MALQNRVTPFGDIIATPEHGMFMGNRGVLHNSSRQIVRPWQVKRWLICVLEFRGRQRTVMAPSRYTELFFLDEATALAAGHRPCFECRRERFRAFQTAWHSSHRGSRKSKSPAPTAGVMDDVLHTERVGPNRSKNTFAAPLDDLPDGVLVQRSDASAKLYLVWRGKLLLWSSGEYLEEAGWRREEELLVLTPRSTVRTIAAGYTPAVHPSADRWQ